MENNPTRIRLEEGPAFNNFYVVIYECRDEFLYYSYEAYECDENGKKIVDIQDKNKDFLIGLGETLLIFHTPVKKKCILWNKFKFQKNDFIYRSHLLNDEEGNFLNFLYCYNMEEKLIVCIYLGLYSQIKLITGKTIVPTSSITLHLIHGTGDRIIDKAIINVPSIDEAIEILNDILFDPTIIDKIIQKAPFYSFCILLIFTAIPGVLMTISSIVDLVKYLLQIIL